MLGNLIEKAFDFLFPKTDPEEMVASLTLEELLLRANLSEKTANGIRFFLPYRERNVRALIHSLKYKESTKAAELLSYLLIDRLSEELSEEMEWQGGAKKILVPLPMSEKRKRDRGYNQTEFLAETTMKLGGDQFFEYASDVLIRNKETPTQTSIRNKEARLKNILDVFEVPNREKIEGKSVILLDDVTTTGATLNEAKRVLLESGVKEVLCVSIAH